jgi:hypothetical protein
MGWQRAGGRSLEEYIAEAVLPVAVIEKPGEEGLILKCGLVFDGEVLQTIA